MNFLWQLSAIRNPFLNAVFRFFSSFGEETIVIVLLCFVYWCLNKKLAYKIGLSFFISGLTVQSMKITFRIPRPWVLDPDFMPLDGATTTATSYSFPSGHTQTATSVYMPVGITSSKTWVKILMCVVTMGVAFARMYLGVHTPADVVTSLIISLLIAQIVCSMTAAENPNNDLILTVVTCIMAIGAIAYSLILYNNGTVPLDYAEDIAKSAGAATAFAISFFIESKYINFDETYGTMAEHFIKVILGLGVIMAIKVGLKPILGTSILAGFIRYFLMIVWGMLIYPLLIKKYIRKKETK